MRFIHYGKVTSHHCNYEPAAASGCMLLVTQYGRLFHHRKLFMIFGLSGAPFSLSVQEVVYVFKMYETMGNC